MFVDMASIWEISWVDLTIRMVLSAVLGGLIGFEREWSNHAAGFRTHILVCLGSTTIMLMSIYGFSQFVGEENVRIDPARLAAQVISGIGFLGAGAILRNGNMIKGLTTAASIWTVAAIGLCVGAGFYIGALLCTLMVLISLYVLNKWEKVLLRHLRYQTVDLRVADSPGLWGHIAGIFDLHGVHVANLTIISGEEAAASEGVEGSAGTDKWRLAPVPHPRSDLAERAGVPGWLESPEPLVGPVGPVGSIGSVGPVRPVGQVGSGRSEQQGAGSGATLHFKLKSPKPAAFVAAIEAIMKLEGVLAVESASLAHADKKAAKGKRPGKGKKKPK